jgi:predicted Rossmann fold nucleotide-binding protein DprA/Smf involved in DNA uptake
MVNYMTDTLSPDTQAILLLCASFGQKGSTEVKPLNVSEYSQVVEWLKINHLRPSNLLDSEFDLNSSQTPISPERLKALLKRGVTLSLATEKWMSQGIWILSRADRQYPQRLKDYLQHQAPPIIYGVGNTLLLSKGGLAIVGSRNVDEEGTEYTQRVAQACVDSEIQVISGGAKGVDRTAMISALEVGGTVVGVMADSLSKEAVSVKYREGLQSQRLTLVSAYDPDAGFNVGTAMGRNKYIYALAEYALVVCSDLNKGGTWTGATEALEKHKSVQVFVRTQGNITEGNRKLLEKGANPFPESPWKNRLRNLLLDSFSFPQMQINGFQDNGNNRSYKATTDDNNLHDINNGLLLISAVDPVKAPDSFYDFFLKIIPRHLKEPSELKYISDSLNTDFPNDIKEVQLKEYLERAVKDGQIQKEKKARKTLYLLSTKSQSATQLALLNPSILS